MRLISVLLYHADNMRLSGVIQKKWHILLLGFFLLAALVLRLHLADNLTLNPDDLGHLYYAGYNSHGHRVSINTDMSDLFERTMTDAHPPLRSMVMAAWLPFVTKFWHVRLPFIVSGLAFTATMAYVFRLLGVSRVVTVGVSLLLLFGKQISILGFETRGYIFMLASSAISIACLLKYERTNRPIWIVSTCVFSLASISFEYSGFFLVASFSFAYLIFSSSKNESATEEIREVGMTLPYAWLRFALQPFSPKSIGRSMTRKPLLCSALLIQCLCFATYMFLVHGNKHFVVRATGRYQSYFNLDVRSMNPIELITYYLELLPRFPLKFFFWESMGLPVMLTLLVCAAGMVFLLVHKKRHAVFLACFLPVILGIALDIVGKYPFLPTRQSIYLLIPFSIFIAHGIDAACKLFPRRIRPAFMVATLGCILYPIVGKSMNEQAMMRFFQREHWHISMSVRDLHEMTTVVHADEPASPSRIKDIVFIDEGKDILQLMEYKWSDMHYKDPRRNESFDALLKMRQCVNQADACESASKSGQALYMTRSRLFASSDYPGFLKHVSEAIDASAVQEFANKSRFMAALLREMENKQSFWLRGRKTYMHEPTSSELEEAVFSFEKQRYRLRYYPKLELFLFIKI